MIETPGLPPFIQSTRNLWSQGRAALCAALLGLLMVACTIVGCSTQEHFSDVTDERFVPSAAEHYEEALQRARDWKPDAYLSTISLIPASPTGSGHDAWLTYMFHSPSTPDSFYVVDLFGGTWSSEVAPKGRMAVTPLPIEREDWSLDSVDAWNIAQANGGADFLARYEDSHIEMEVSLKHLRVGTSENVLAWRVWYTVEPVRRGGHLDVMIDPKTGDILDLKTDW